MHIDKLDDIVNIFYDTYHRTTKMMPVNKTSSTYIDSCIENIDKDPKFKVEDHVKISKYKNIFTKVYTPNWSEEVSVIKKLKTPCFGHTLLGILMMKKLMECFSKRIFKKQIKQGLGLKK